MGKTLNPGEVECADPRVARDVAQLVMNWSTGVGSMSHFQTESSRSSFFCSWPFFVSGFPLAVSWEIPSTLVKNLSNFIMFHLWNNSKLYFQVIVHQYLMQNDKLGCQINWNCEVILRLWQLLRFSSAAAATVTSFAFLLLCVSRQAGARAESGGMAGNCEPWTDISISSIHFKIRP